MSFRIRWRALQFICIGVNLPLLVTLLLIEWYMYISLLYVFHSLFFLCVILRSHGIALLLCARVLLRTMDDVSFYRRILLSHLSPELIRVISFSFIRLFRWLHEFQIGRCAVTIRSGYTVWHVMKWQKSYVKLTLIRHQHHSSGHSIIRPKQLTCHKMDLRNIPEHHHDWLIHQSRFVIV